MPLDQLLKGVWRLRCWLLLAVLLGWGGGAALILSWPRAYVAAAVVAPAETSGIAVSTLIAANSLAPGSLLDTRPGGNFAIYLAALRSPEAVAMLLQETPLLETLTEARADSALAPLRAALELDRPPDADDAQRWLERSLSVTQSFASVTWTLELAHPRRELALALLERLHDFAERRVREELMALVRRRVGMLEARLAQERDIYLRTPLFELLAQHQRALLVIGADSLVAARLVSGPAVEQRPSLPNRPLLLALLGVAVPLACVFLAACLVLLRAPAAARRRGGGQRGRKGERGSRRPERRTDRRAGDAQGEEHAGGPASGPTDGPAGSNRMEGRGEGRGGRLRDRPGGPGRGEA